jgi:rhodanese-related sulfurtransferase
MWSFLRNLLRSHDEGRSEADRASAATAKISSVQLASLFWCAPHKLMVFDLRTLAEVEQCPQTIPGALLTTHVDISALIRWIPPETVVVLYAADDVPHRFAQLAVPLGEPRVRLLDGGLRSWWQEGLPMETVTLHEKQSHEKR